MDQPSDEVYAEVAVEARGNAAGRTYTYLVPGELRGRVGPGSYVMVPFGWRYCTGYVVAMTGQAPPVKLKPIARLLTDEPVVSTEQLAMARWVAAEYLAPVADALRLFLPPGGARNIVERVRLVGEAAQAAVGRAARQRAVVQALQDAGGEATMQALLRRLRSGGWPECEIAALRRAVRALEDKGLVAVERSLRPPAARPLTRKVVALADRTGAEQAMAELGASAPRQAVVLQTLLAATDGRVPLAELPAAAVRALQRRGLVRVEDARTLRRPEGGLDEAGQYLEPTPAQRAAIERVGELLRARRFSALLLHGVTGSGKTEVYLHCIREALRAGRNAIVLVPEISLTPQILGRVAARFGDQVALLHSALSPGERFDEWQRLRAGQARIAVGPRSALFAPLDNIGLIVVDEEHEAAYKQESSPRYHARAVAFELARRHQAVLLLGSATPAIETYYAAESGTIELFELPERIDNRPLPRVHIVDLRQDPAIGEGRTFSEPLAVAMEDALARGEQVILFLNRRGFSTFIVCRKCGHRMQCPDCGVSLTYHHRLRRLLCHYCGYQRPAPEKCEKCGSEDLGFLGLGTERVAEQVQRRFGEVAVARMDRDTVQRRGAHREILAAFARGDVQVLVGTQMVAKGLDFPGVTLVGVLNADVGLAWSDFRAAERTFQLLTQVAGRAGRADKPGIVVVQTYSPEHPAIKAAARHDYAAFYAWEIENRRRVGWPPFVHIARLVFADEDEGRAEALAQSVALKLEDMGVPRADGRVHYLGPSKAPLERLRGRWRYHLVVRAEDRGEMIEALAELSQTREWQRAGGVIDIDPMDMI